MTSISSDTGLVPPQIAPVQGDESLRPTWSVMIPTFNCAKYLEKTLESVLRQAPGMEQMQIEVVDDCSTKDDPSSVVERLGKGRVHFHRKSKNEGAIANFNTCIARSRGRLVHILHGDDWIGDGFYQAILSASKQQPKASLIAARVIGTDEEGHPIWVSPRLKDLEVGGSDPRSFYYDNRLQFAGNVMRREFYERHGGFRTSLIHTADAEMWVRAIYKGGAIVLPEALGYYRNFPQNDTGRLAKTAANIEDLLRLHRIFVSEYPEFDQARGTQRASDLAMAQAKLFLTAGDQEAYLANFRCWKRIATPRLKARHWIKRAFGR